MLGNLAFTLYELFGYLLPGGLVLLGLVILYWSIFVPGVPLSIATFEPGLVTWASLVIVSYLLGHAVQGVSNTLLKGAEDAALAPTSSAPWMRQRALELAAKLLGVSPDA